MTRFRPPSLAPQYRFGEADVSDHPLVAAALAYKTATSDFLNLISRAPELEQRFAIGSATVAEVPAILTQLIDELDPAANLDVTESARSGLYSPRCLESATATVAPRTQKISDVFALPLRESDVVGRSRARVMVIRSGPGNAAQRNWYSNECLAQAVESKMFDSAQSYLDHAVGSDFGSVRDLAGSLSAVELGSYEDPELGKVPAIFATFTPTSTQAGETAIALCRDAVAQRNSGNTAPLVGISINCFGSGSPAEIDGETWNRIDEFTEVLSVDIVARAGAGGGVVSLLENARRRTRKPFEDLEESTRILEATMRATAPALYRPSCQD